MRKRFILLNVFIVLSVILSAVLICINARQYTVTSPLYGAEVKAEDVEFIAENRIVKVENVRIEDGSLIYTVVADGRGKDYLTFVFPGDNEDNPYYESLEVYYAGWFGTVFRLGDFDFEGFSAVLWVALIDMLAVFGVTLWSFIEKWRRAEFSYVMTAYGGIAIFMLAMMLNNFLIGGSFDMSAGYVMWEFASSGEEFVWLAVPLAVAFALSVTVSNISLMLHEGFRPVNALGIILSILMIGGRVFLFFAFNYIAGSEMFVRMMDLLENLLCTVIAYLESMLYATIISAWLASRHKPPYDRDYLVILGCALMGDGTPTPLLRMRADSALRFEREQYERTGRHAFFVPSGGQGTDEIISEGESVSRYLQEQGIPEEQILPETESVNTRENFTFSKRVIEEHAAGRDYNAAFATTNYHVFRSYIFAEKAGLRAQGISAKTKLYFFPNAFLREFVGLLAEEWKNHLIFLALILASFAVVNLVIPF